MNGPIPSLHEPLPLAVAISAASALTPDAAADLAEGEGAAECEHIVQDTCDRQNPALLATAAGYVSACVLIISVWRMVWNRRGTSTAFTRMVVPMIVGAGGAGLLVGFDPAGSKDLKCCLAEQIYRSRILLADSTIGRAVLLGAIPLVVVYFAITTTMGVVRALRK